MTSSPSLRSTLLFLSKNASLFLAVRIFGACVSLGLVPVFTRYLTKSEYGTIAILDSTVEIFGALFAIGLGRAVVRFFHNTDNDWQRNRIVSTGMVISSTITIFALIVLAFVYRPVAFLAFKSHDNENFVLLAISTLLIGIPGGIVSAVLMASERSRLVCIIEFIRIIFSTLLKLILVVFLEKGIEGVLWTNFTVAVLFNFGMAVWMFFSVGINIDRSLIRPMIRYGLPFAPGVICSIAMSSLNRFYLNAYGTTEQVGLYQLAYQLPAAIYSMIAGSFERIWSSHTVFIVSQASDASNQYKRISTYFLSFLSFVLFAIAISANLIVKIFAAPSYAPAALYVPFIAFSFWIQTFNIFVRTGVILSKDTYLLTLNYLLTLGMTVLFNWLLISRFGTYGAAYAAILIYFSFSFVGGFIYKGFGYLDLRRMIPISIIWITLVLLRYRIGYHSIYTEILCIIFFSTLYLWLMFYLPFCMPKEERNNIFDFIKNTLKQKGNILQMFKS